MSHEEQPVEELIAELAAQEERLQFDRFDNDDAWALGSLLVEVARERSLPIPIDVRRGGCRSRPAGAARWRG